MLKKSEWLLLLLTVLFLVGCLGFLLGRRSLTETTVATQRSVPLDVRQTPETAPETTAPLFPVCINTADRAALTRLPGIGQVLAERIVAYRDEHGSFAALDELMQVEGIGSKTFESVKDYISLE